MELEKDDDTWWVFIVEYHVSLTDTSDSQGRTLKRKMENAIKWKWEHRVALYDLEETIQPALLDEWGKEVEMWEEDNTRPNPFESKLARMSLPTHSMNLR